MRRRLALRRAVAVAVVGLLISAVTALYMMKRPGVYWSQVNVLFLAPTSEKNPNSLQTDSESVISTAGVIAKMVTGNQHGAQVVSDSVTLVGQGIRHGYSVRLPNDGGQWAVNFDKPLLDVQSAGSSAEEATATMNRVLAEIAADVNRIQSGVAAHNRIAIRLNPATPPIYYLHGSRMRAGGATVLLGTGITAAIAFAVWRRSLRPRPAPHQTPVSG